MTSKKSKQDALIAEALFAMVANRALAPSSKLAVEQWASDEVYLGEHQPLQVQHCYRAMDFLLEHEQAIQKEVFWSTANLLNLTVDLIFFELQTKGNLDRGPLRADLPGNIANQPMIAFSTAVSTAVFTYIGTKSCVSEEKILSCEYTTYRVRRIARLS